MELDSPGKTSCAECISTPLSKITSIPLKHHSGTGCLEGISCPLGRIDPKGKQWIITWQRGRCVGGNWEWECHTDVPIILFAYISTHPPWKKAGSHVKRGVVTHHDPTIYFPYDFISCQNEEGEVTEHTFTWPFYPDNEVFWWRCGGRTGGWFPKWSASRSPFWNAKCAAPAYECTIQCPAIPGNIAPRKWQSRITANYPPDYVYCNDNASACSYNLGNNIQYHHRLQYSGGWSIRRNFQRIDTSAIPADAQIQSAFIRVGIAGDVIGDPTPPLWQGGGLAVLKCDSPPDPWACVQNMWNYHSTLNEILACKDLPIPIQGSYDLTFDPSEYDYINKGGVTYVACRCVSDIARASKPGQGNYQMASIWVSLLQLTYKSATPCPE